MANNCDGRVAIVTGGGAGLGAAHARALAGFGTHVIVNDIDEQAACSVVNEITRQGGSAVVNTHNICDYSNARCIVEQAINTFGDLHTVVNNAGINRDKMFVSMAEKEWDEIIAVHLKGHFCISSHAVKHWRNQAKSGKSVKARIINTTSGAGLQGSVGQSSYAAAKAGIAALTINQAEELRRYGITANAIAPAARTKMTTAVEAMAKRMAKPCDDSFDYWAPENISPLVVWLSMAESHNVTGKIFEIQGGELSIADGWRTTQGLDKGERWSVDDMPAVVNYLLKQEVPAQKVYGS